MNNINHATTVALLKKHLRKANVIERIFEMFESYQRDKGLIVRSGQIIPCRKITEEPTENKEIKANHQPTGWNKSIKLVGQRDLDAGWVKKLISTQWL